MQRSFAAIWCMTTKTVLDEGGSYDTEISSAAASGSALEIPPPCKSDGKE